MVTWQITAGQSPTATLSFSCAVRPPATAQTVPGDAVRDQPAGRSRRSTTEDVATSGEVEPDGTATEHVFLPHGVDTEPGGRDACDVAPSLAAGAAQAVDYVKDESYDSTEQTVSRFLPLLRLNKAYARAGLTTPYSAEVPGLVNRALVRALSRPALRRRLGLVRRPRPATPT